MGKRTRYTNVHVTLAVTPPPTKTWKTPSYHLERYTIRRHVRVVSVQLHGIRGNERRTESISFPLLSGVTDTDFARAAVWFSPHKWTAAFGMNVSQFQGKFSHAVDGRLIAALMGSSENTSQPLPLQQNIAPVQQTPLPYQVPPPFPQPGQFNQSASMSNLSPRGRKRGMWGWYQTKSRKTKVGIGCGTLIALIVFFSLIGTAIGSTNTTTPPTPTPTNKQAAVVVTPTEAATQQATNPTVTITVKPQPTTTPKSQPTVQSTPRPTPHPSTSTPCPGINCNPWGYNFSPGNLIYYPPNGFCNVFTCITSFYSSDDPGDGYIVQCSDGTFSQSGGERGACSSHGGVSRPLYAH